MPWLRGRTTRWIGALAGAVVLAAAAVWALSRPEPVRILAAPELADLRPVLDDFTRETGVPVELVTAESAQIPRRVARRPDFDAVWSPTDPEPDGHRLGAGVVVMSSPVVLGLRKSLADDLGWANGDVTWERIAEAAREGDFTFGMSDPERSFSGRSVVLAAATGLAGAVGALSKDDVHPAASGLQALSTAQAFTAATDAGLVEGFLREQGGIADGLFAYESQIARLNDSGRLTERLVVLRPGDGVIAARYALRPLLRPRTSETAANLARLTDHLLARRTQQRIADLTHRRPGVPGVTLPAPLSGPVPRLLDVPKDQYVVNRLTDAYLGRYSYAARMLLLLDVSGSMRGAGIARLREAAAALVEAPLTDTPRSNDEQAILLPFASRPAEPMTLYLRPGDAQDVDALLDGLVPRGNTALYDALVAGYRELAKFSGDDRVVSILLLTDGRSGRGRDLAGFLRHRAALPPELQAVPVYPVLVDGADVPEMRALAARTGGRVLDARRGDLASAFLASRARRAP